MRKDKKRSSQLLKVVGLVLVSVISIILISSLVFIFQNKDKINKLQHSEKPRYVNQIENK